VAEKLITAAKIGGGRACGWEAFEVGRIEAGIPRYGVDMDETNLAPETGIEDLAISYTKGCYIGQEVISRIRTYGQVQRHLRGLRLLSDPDRLPHKGDKLFYEGREAGYVTSAVRSHKFQAVIALGYVRREADIMGNVLSLGEPAANESARVVELPFQS
jgi:folate-binding protein YgfZ